MVSESEEPQINQGEIEVKVAYNHCEFGFDPDAEADADASDESESDASPTKRSFMCGGRGRWVLAAATLLFTAFVVFLGTASVPGIVSHHKAQAQAAIKVRDNGSGSKSDKSKRSKSGKSSSYTDAEEPDGDAVRAKYEGSVTVANLDCDSDTECVQSAQNALKAVLEEIICSDLTPPLIPPCWVVVNPNPQVEDVTVEAGRRRLDLISLWEFIVSATIAGAPDQATIDSASAAISDVAASVAAAVGFDIEVIVEGVVAAFEVLVMELSPDPYEWTAVIPNVTGYQLVGEGYCTDINGDYFGGIKYQASTVQECVAKCKDSVCYPENGWTLTGVELEGDDCYCLDDEVNVVGGSCSDSSADLGCINYGPGTGQPWFSGPIGQSDGVLCFRFI